MPESLEQPVSQRRRGKRPLLWLGGSGLLLAVMLAVTALLLWRQAVPFLRARVVNSLADHFHARVELDQFDASASHGFEVSGSGLRIIPFGLEAFPPVITVQRFAFHMDPMELFNASRHVRSVQVVGLRITLPPRSQRGGFSLLGTGGAHGDAKKDPAFTVPKIYVDTIDATDAELTLLTDNPGHAPLQFAIHTLHLDSHWATAALHYRATLRNARPTGEILAEGEFGPWNAAAPRTTPLSGTFRFDNADLATTRGIAGILSSTGKFSGPLDQLTVDGQATVPDFRVEEAQHRVALAVEYHARVDGTSGDTFLQPAVAHFRNSTITCTGSIVRVPGQGHHIALNIAASRARIEDLLWIGTRTSPPVINGDVRLHTTFDLPPNGQRRQTVAQRMALKGALTVTNMFFSNEATEKKISDLSLRASRQAAQERPGVALYGTLDAHFAIQHALVAVEPATYSMPGIDATLAGNYSLDGQTFDFSGNAKLQATLSQMFTGWKGTLLKPADRLFAKHGAGVYVPFHIGGTKDAPHFGLDLDKR